MTLRDKLTDRGWVECGTCEGVGRVVEHSDSQRPHDAGYCGQECTALCSADCCGGLVPPDDQVEAAARAAFGDETFDHDGSSWFLSRQGLHTKQARAALVAAARKEKG